MKVLIEPIIILVVLYLLFCFAMFSFNPGQWGLIARCIFAVSWLSLSILNHKYDV